MSSAADMFIAIGCLLKKFQFHFDVYSDQQSYTHLTEGFFPLVYTLKRKIRRKKLTNEQTSNRVVIYLRNLLKALLTHLHGIE